MIEINLLPQEYRPKEAPKFVMPEIPIKRVLTPVAVAIVGVQLLVSLFAVYQTVSLGIVRAQVTGLSQEGSLIAKRKQEITAIKERLTRIKALAGKNYRWHSILNAVSDSVTKGVWLTGFSVEDSKAANTKVGSAPGKVLRIEGSVIGQGEETAYIGKFIISLKSNAVFKDLFSDVELSNIAQKKIREFDVYDFSVACAFKPDKLSRQ